MTSRLIAAAWAIIAAGVAAAVHGATIGATGRIHVAAGCAAAFAGGGDRSKAGGAQRNQAESQR